MKDYQIGDLMLVPFTDEEGYRLIEAEILHIPQLRHQQWIFKHPTLEGKAFGIHTGSPIVKWESKTTNQ